MIDESTGLPELPEGYFWRVKKVISPFAEIQIVRRWWFLHFVIESTPFYRNELTADELRESARFILDFRNPFITPDETLYGTYPPKKLETS